MSLVEQTVDSWGVRIVENEKTLTELKLTDKEFEVSIGKKADTSNIISMINASSEGIKIQGSKVNITGYVTFSDLSSPGQTTISGSNITTGTIDASKANITNINASNITTGTLSGDYIYGGILKGVLLQTYADDASKGVSISKDSLSLNSTYFSYYTLDEFRISSPQRIAIGSANDVYLMPGLISGSSQTDANNVVIPNATLRTQRLTVINDATIQGDCAVSGNFSCVGISSVGAISCATGFSAANGGVYVTSDITTTGGNINATAGTITAKALKSNSSVSCASISCTGDASFENNVWIKYLYVNGTWVSSDKRKKMDIRYVDKDSQSIAESGLIAPNVNINKNDMYEFVEALPIASYRYIDDVENGKDITHYGLVVQDVLYTKVGSELVKVLDDNKHIGDEDDYMGYSQEKLLTFVCGALQREMQLRQELQERVEELENKLK
jgi:hypothetical protein